MHNFEWNLPTKLVYGQGELSRLGKISKDFGRKAFLATYRPDENFAGIFEKALSSLKEAGIEVTIFDRVEPNPRAETVDQGVQLFLQSGSDFVVALGGGSVIDAAKYISATAFSGGSAWDYVILKERPAKEYTGAHPIVAVPTVSAAGSEANAGGVLTNWETKEKSFSRSPYRIPKVAIIGSEKFETMTDDIIRMYGTLDGNEVPGPRPTRLIYDRTNSAFTTLRFDEIDLDYLKTARLVHLCGITPALGEDIDRLTHQIIDHVGKSGTFISFDVNYRSKLWSPSIAKKILTPIVKKVDILICSLNDAATIFDFSSTDAEEVVKCLQQEYHNQIVVLTMADNGAVAFDGQNTWYQDTYQAGSVDRIGRGDSFSAGFLYGYLNDDALTGLKYGNAMAALNQTLKGDFFWCGKEEVDQLIAGRSKKIDR